MSAKKTRPAEFPKHSHKEWKVRRSFGWEPYFSAYGALKDIKAQIKLGPLMWEDIKPSIVEIQTLAKKANVENLLFSVFTASHYGEDWELVIEGTGFRPKTEKELSAGKTDKERTSQRKEAQRRKKEEEEKKRLLELLAKYPDLVPSGD